MDISKHYDYFLVYFDDHKGNIGAKTKDKDNVVRFLKEEGFSCAKGFWGCTWYFVDIVNKVYLPGRPGVCYGRIVGEHAVTFDEFKTIYSIYKKYDTEHPLKVE